MRAQQNNQWVRIDLIDALANLLSIYNMFTLILEAYKLWFDPRQYNILICGIDGCGKTKLLNAFKRNFTADLTDDSKIIPTTGLNLTNIDLKNCRLRLWDMGGRQSIRGIWSHYFPEAHGLFYVISPQQIKERHSQIMDVLRNLLKQQDLEDVPITVIINNREMVGEDKLSELKKYVRMVMESRAFAIFTVGSLSKEQLSEILGWNQSKLVQISKSLNY